MRIISFAKPNTVYIENIRPKDKIYVLARNRKEPCYKLHKGSDGRWSFIALINSEYHAAGFQVSAKTAMEAVGTCGTIMEFNNIREFAEWLVE